MIGITNHKLPMVIKGIAIALLVSQKLIPIIDTINELIIATISQNGFFLSFLFILLSDFYFL